MKKLLITALLIVVPVALLAGCGGQGASQNGGAEDGGGNGDGKKKIFVALSYSGNLWQDEAANLAMAIAKTPPFDEEVIVEKQIAGTEVQAQISQYQSMIAEGADAIVSFPVSPTGLNQTIKQGCEQGVKFFMYDATVTEPCAWNVSYITGATTENPDQPYFGASTAQWLADELGGEGKIFMNRGVPGNSVDQTHYDTAKEVFDEYPGIEIVAEYYGMWDASTSQKETASALAANPEVDGVWSELGESGVLKAFLDAGRPLVPITGENANSFRLALADPELKERGLTGVSSGSPPYQAGYAVKLAMKVLEEGDESVPKNVEVPLPWVTADDVKICEGDRFENGCNTFPEGKVPEDFVTEVFDEELLPESSLTAALEGEPTPGATIQPLPEPLEVPEDRLSATRGAEGQ